MYFIFESNTRRFFAENLQFCQELSIEYFLAKFGVDTEENAPDKVCSFDLIWLKNQKKVRYRTCQIRGEHAHIEGVVRVRAGTVRPTQTVSRARRSFS